MLFGTRGPYDFYPIAANRGLPTDVSWRVKEDAKEDNAFHSHTWVTWREILLADRDESVAVSVNAEYRMNDLGEWEKYSWTFPNSSEAGLSWQEGDGLFKTERLRLREMLKSTDFDFAFEIMEITAKRYGDDYIRLVVWFDS